MLKTTGIIRKIDELGRIVIPKELRGVLGIKSGDSLSFLVDDGRIILEKYEAMDNLKDKSTHIISSVNDLVDAAIFISDNEKFLTKGILENKKLPPLFLDLLINRKNYLSKEIERMTFDDEILEGYFLAKCLIKDSNPIGILLLYKRSIPLEQDDLFAKIIKNIIENS